MSQPYYSDDAVTLELLTKAWDAIARVLVACDEADDLARAEDWIDGMGALTTTEIRDAIAGGAT